MKNILLALTAAFVFSGCPDTTRVPKAPPRVPEPKAAQNLQTLQVKQPMGPAGQSWIVERAPERPVWPL